MNYYAKENRKKSCFGFLSMSCLCHFLIQSTSDIFTSAKVSNLAKVNFNSADGISTRARTLSSVEDPPMTPEARMPKQLSYILAVTRRI